MLLMPRRIGSRLLAALLTAAALAPASAQATAVNPVLSGFVTDTTTLPGVTAVAIAGHYAYVTDYYAGELTAIDISNPAAPVIAGSSPPLGALLNASTVNIAGGYAFVAAKNRNGPLGSESNDDGSGNALTILDIASNPASPSILGTIRDSTVLFGAYGVAVSGHYAFVSAQGCLSGQPCPKSSVGNAFAVIDISNPAAPTIVATLRNSSLPAPFTGTGALLHATSVAISEGYAYVTAAYENRLTIINVTNPLSPKIVASLKDKNNLSFPVDVAISGKYAYVVDQVWPGKLAVVDITNPSSPQVVKLLESTVFTDAYRIRLHGDFAYISASGAAKVVVIDISNPLNPRLLTTITSTARLNKTTGLDVDPSATHVVASSPYLSTESQPLYPPYALQLGGPTLWGTVSEITLDPSPIATAIAPESEPANPTSQTSASFGFSVNDVVSAVQCELDGAPWSPCTTATGQTYSGLATGPHGFQVQAIDSAGNTSTAGYGWAITAPPANTVPPALSGNTVQGETLTAAPGSWSGYPTPTLTYQWNRCDTTGANCVPIAEATASTYTLTPADTDNTLTVTVTATNSTGTIQASSPASTLIASPPANTTLPTLSGNTSQGETLTASPGSWSGYPTPNLTYQWNRCDAVGVTCEAIPGATSPTYVALSADIGNTLTVTVTATNLLGASEATSAASAPIAAPPSNTTAPAISGNTSQGETLTASPGSWSGYPTPNLTYQWNRCGTTGANCVPIAEATASTYTLTPADTGNTLTVTVTATNLLGASEATSAASAPTAAPPTNTAAPTLSGSATEGQTLTAAPGSWSGYPSPTLTYQWNRCNALGLICEAIPNATSPTYLILSADVGHMLTMTVTATNFLGVSQATSAASALVVSAAGPLTPLLDSFTRPNNTGPPGPNWAHMLVSSSGPGNDLYVTNNQVTGRSGTNADYWGLQTYGPNSEVWLTVAVKPNIDLDPVVLGLRFQNPAAANASGYQAYYIYRSGQLDQYRIVRRTEGANSTILTSANGPTLQAGDELLFRAIGTTLELWRLDAAVWTKIVSASDSTYQGAGYINLTARDWTVRLVNFGGGTLP
jgi:hypothetical protein